MIWSRSCGRCSVTHRPAFPVAGEAVSLYWMLDDVYLTATRPSAEEDVERATKCYIDVLGMKEIATVNSPGAPVTVQAELARSRA